MSASSQPQATAILPERRHSRPVVLHVDDDAANLLMAEGPLEDAGYEVIHAGDGFEAVTRFDECRPDMIIMDAVMPGLDGFGAIARIRLTEIGEHVPILMIIGLEDPDSITRAYDVGATDFLTQPVNVCVLPHRVQYMLRSHSIADALRASEARLDNAQRIARLGHWEWTLDSDELAFSRGFLRVCPALAGLASSRWSDFIDAISEAERDGVRLAADRALATRSPFSIEFDVAPHGESGARTLRLEAEPHPEAADACTHLLGTVQDITERRSAQEQIHTLAYYDVLTGLPNRAQLHERLAQAFQRAGRANTQFAVMFLDLDYFKQVNDTLGHDVGDALLQTVSARIKEVLRDSDTLSRDDGEWDAHTVARLGGDEFVVLLDPIHRSEDAARVAQRIAASIRAPMRVCGNDVAVSTTIGISVFPEDGDDADTLLKHADVAMYHAKENGRDGYQFYSSAIHERSLERFSLERELRHAITEGELRLVFQPKVRIGDGTVTGCEALVRWQHPERGEISPADFIPLAEDTGLILPLGRWVLESACRQMQAWIDAGIGPFSIAVNCSPIQFTRGDMLDELAAALSDSGLAPEWLEIELTESLLMQDIDAGVDSLEAMQRLGVQVSIDDFGTGHSSLSYLKRLPADKLKIDRSFVDDLVADPGDAAIVAAVVQLAHDLGLSVIGEGVETDAQLAVLAGFGCDEVQGYLISAPLEAAEFVDWLVRHPSEWTRADAA